MQATNDSTTQTINTLEEYTVYSLEQSVPTLLHMMERSKQVAVHWPELPALMSAAELCKEINALADYQTSLQDTLGESGDESDRKREEARQQLFLIMDSMEDALNMNDPEIAKRLFAVDLPGALNEFMNAVPSVCQHIRDNFMPDSANEKEDGTVE